MVNERLPRGLILGVDGARGGWVGVAQYSVDGGSLDGGSSDGGTTTLSLLQVAQWTALPLEAAAAVAVDMPIGLPESGRRSCDRAARAVLGGRRGASVFAPPRRPMLAAPSYAQANAWGRAEGTGGISRQAWGLRDKIAELDRWITPARQAQVVEAHPELAFQRLAGGPAPASKRTPEGLRWRRAILEAHGLALAPLEARLDRRHAGLDDLYDAAVLVSVATRLAAGLAQPLPATPERDSRGLAMAIWC